MEVKIKNNHENKICIKNFFAGNWMLKNFTKLYKDTHSKG